MPAFASEEGTHASRPGQQAAIFPALRLPRQPGSGFRTSPVSRRVRGLNGTCERVHS